MVWQWLTGERPGLPCVEAAGIPSVSAEPAEPAHSRLPDSFQLRFVYAFVFVFVLFVYVAIYPGLGRDWDGRTPRRATRLPSPTPVALVLRPVPRSVPRHALAHFTFIHAFIRAHYQCHAPLRPRSFFSSLTQSASRLASIPACHLLPAIYCLPATALNSKYEPTQLN